MWYHADCQQLTNKQMEVLGNDVPQDYVCSSCSQPNGNFDYRSSLSQLAFYMRGRLGALRSTVILEGILLRDIPLRIPTNENVDIRGKKVDYLDQTLLDKLGKNHLMIIIIIIHFIIQKMYTV